MYPAAVHTVSGEMALGLVERLPLGLAVLRTPSGEPVYVNRVFTDTVGSPGALPLEGILTARGPVQMRDQAIRRADGAEVRLWIFASPLPADLEGGPFVGVAVAVMDITEPAAPSPDQPARTGRGKVLIVDDDRLVARVLCAELEQAGFEVRVTYDAEDARSIILEDDSIELVYCDVMLKGMNGVELYEQIARRAHERLHKLVLMTGGAFTPMTRAFLDQRPGLAIDKPFDIVGDAARRLARRQQ